VRCHFPYAIVVQTANNAILKTWVLD